MDVPPPEQSSAPGPAPRQNPIIELTPTQKKTVAAGLTVLCFAVVLTFVAFVGWALMGFLGFISPALTPVIVGIFLSMLFKPYFEWLRKCVRKPTLALVLMLLSLLVPCGLLCWFGWAFVVDQALHLFKSAPAIVTRLSAWVNESYPDVRGLVAQLEPKSDSLLVLFLQDPEHFTGQVVSMLGNAYGADAMKAGLWTLKYLRWLGSALIAMIFFGVFLMRPAMTGDDYVKMLLPFLKEETQAFVAKQVDTFFDILVNFFQRQVVICLIEGVLYGAGFMLVGLPYGFIVGFMLGALNLVPLLGTVTCLPLALPIAYFGDGGSKTRMVLVLVVWLTGQVLDGYLITPKIQGGKTGLGYAGVIFSFFFWGVVFQSMLGLLLAIPLSAFCVVLWRAVKEKYIKGVI